MKKSELFFSALLVPIDYFAILLAGIIAYEIRYLEFIKQIRPVVFHLRFSDYMISVAFFAVAWIGIFALQGLYAIKKPQTNFSEFIKIFVGCSAGIALVMAVMFFTRYLFDSRFIILIAWILSIFFVSFARAIIRLIQRNLYMRGIGVHRVIMIGNGNMESGLGREFEKEKRHGYRVIKIYDDFSDEKKSEILELAKKDLFDEIILMNPDIPKNIILNIIDFTDSWHKDFKYAADILGTKTSRLEIQTYANVPIVEIKKTPLDGWGRILKRIFDILFSLLLIILTLPLMIGSAIAIKIDSRGSIFFRYKRVGEKGKKIDFMKFRTMVENAHTLRYDKEFQARHKNLREGTPMVKFENDPRITRVGKFLRRWSIDEFPQFFLVLFGKMSLVGPRPHESEEVAQYDKIQNRVLTLKPGITGLAQVSGRSDLNFNEEVKLDIFYVENWSLLLDLQILLKTPLAVFRKRKTL